MARRIPQNPGTSRARNRRWILIAAVAVVLLFYIMGPGGLLSGIDHGRPAPDIVAATLDGKDFRLQDLKGDLVLLDFWASWCGPCRLSVPEVDALFRQSAEGDPPLRVIGINQGEDAVTARRAATELGMTYPVVLDRDMAIGNRYGASSIPLFVLLDTDGTVLWKQVGFRPGIMDEAARIIRERRTR
jgi:thiol-disulfide isomerase/thioredoxin